MPFELGRPFGPPRDEAFQIDVLRAVLGLLERESGPVLADYPREAPPASEGEDVWACPLPQPALPEAANEEERGRRRLLAEVRSLSPWYDEAVRASGRTAFGVSGLPPAAVEAAALALWDVANGGMPAAPEGAAAAMPLLIRFLADDLKAFYFEAAAAQPGARRPSPAELNQWLFRETVLGGLLYDARDRLRASGERDEQRAGIFLVPAAFSRR